MNRLLIGDIEVKIPVIQGGMGVGISLSNLAGHVALHGGLGILSTAQIGYRDPDWDLHPIQANLRQIGIEMQKAKEIAHGGIVGVNIMVATRNYEDYVKAACEAGADVIISGAGLPMTLPMLVKQYSVKIAPIVSSEKALRIICKYWNEKYERLPDFVVVEGPLAGGHLGFSAEQIETYTKEEYDQEIVKIIQYAKQYSIPVVVAGGIFDAEDVRHAMQLGAAGVQMGTRFVTTYECDAPPAYKQAYINANKEDIVLVKSPVGMPGRAISNHMLRSLHEDSRFHGRCHQCINQCKSDTIPYCITNALVEAAKGNIEDGLIFCGSNAYRCDKLEHVEDILKEIQKL